MERNDIREKLKNTKFPFIMLDCSTDIPPKEEEMVNVTFCTRARLNPSLMASSWWRRQMQHTHAVPSAPSWKE